MKSKPATGKASVKIVKNPETGRTNKVSYGQKGVNVDSGSKRADAYCARSNAIKGDWRDDPNSPNSLSRKKWKCIGSRSKR
jgi:hypothetical protein